MPVGNSPFLVAHWLPLPGLWHKKEAVHSAIPLFRRSFRYSTYFLGIMLFRCGFRHSAGHSAIPLFRRTFRYSTFFLRIMLFRCAFRYSAIHSAIPLFRRNVGKICEVSKPGSGCALCSNSTGSPSDPGAWWISVNPRNRRGGPPRKPGKGRPPPGSGW